VSENKRNTSKLNMDDLRRAKRDEEIDISPSTSILLDLVKDSDSVDDRIKAHLLRSMDILSQKMRITEDNIAYIHKVVSESENSRKNVVLAQMEIRNMKVGERFDKQATINRNFFLAITATACAVMVLGGWVFSHGL